MNNKKTIKSFIDWFRKSLHLNRTKMFNEEIDMLQRRNFRLYDTLNATEKRMSLLECDLNNTIEQNNVYREICRHMNKKIDAVETEKCVLYLLLLKLRAHGIEIQGELADEFKNAIDDGKRALKAYDHSHLKMRKTHE